MLIGASEHEGYREFFLFEHAVDEKSLSGNCLDQGISRGDSSSDFLFCFSSLIVSC